MSKNCLIYETLNGVKDLNVKRDGDLMTLTGVFGVCGVRNNNQRVYETSNYSKMVTEMKDRIKEEGGIPGELEHPQMMNITLENVSHKITDINIDENGVVTGSITLLNTPKGKIAQAIVEGGLPLFISSRATGNVDKSGKVCLEKIATYDLVGTPGFSQAKLHLNENQVAESINESNIYYITEKETGKNEIDNDMELDEILEKMSALEDRINDLEQANEDLQEQLNESNNNFDVQKFADGIQKWIVEEYSPVVQNWCMEHLQEEFSNNIQNDVHNMFVESIAPKIQEWIVEEYSPEIQKWIVEDYSPEVEKWCKTEFAEGIQKWIVEEFSPEVENWLTEHYSESVQDQIDEALSTDKKNNLNSIDETLKVLESLEVTKPNYSRKALVTENLNEPKFIAEMPADKRVQWDMADNSIKESIMRRAKLYNFVNEGAIERFWNNIHFEDVKPVQNIYEGLQTIEDERERHIRNQFRTWKARR